MADQKTAYLYAGDFSFKDPEACGIHGFDYDIQSQKLTPKGTWGSCQSTSILSIDGDILFATVENRSVDLLTSYRIKDDGDLEELDSIHTGCFLPNEHALDIKNKFLFFTDMSDCSVVMVSYDENGKLEVDDKFIMPDPGSYAAGLSTVERQEVAHAHCVRLMPDGRHIVVCCHGNDHVYILEVDAENKKLIPIPEFTILISYGEGPRNMSFTPDGRYGYMNTEMGNTIYAFKVGEDSSLTLIQKLSTLDPDKENPPRGMASVTKISKDGKYAFTGNRGQNNIAGFIINDDGTLTPNGFFDSYGAGPRDMTFGYDDDVLFVGNSDSGDLAVIKYDKENGKLGECLQDEKIPGVSHTAWILM